MPIKTTFTITYQQCGHTETNKDLSHKEPHKRAGFARWLSSKAVCTDCYRSKNSSNEEWIEDRDEWLARRREAEAAQVAEWEKNAQMPPLNGSEKAAAWAGRVRHQAMVALHTHMVEEGDDEQGFDSAEEIARHIDRAGFWLDNRDQVTDPEALLELLHSAAADEGMDCENTY